MSDQPFNVLLTSVGRRVELVRIFKRALDSLKVPGNVVAIDANPLAPALRLADKSFLVPLIADEQYIPTVVDICRQERIAYVFPLLDPDVLLLALHRQQFEDVGTCVTGLTRQPVLTARDKWKTMEFLREINLPAPRSWLREGIAADEMNYPLFIKPRHGSASEQAHKVESARELEFLLDRVPDPIVQEFLSRPEYTTDVTCYPAGEILAVISRRRITTRDGEMARGVTVFDPVVTAHCVKMAKALGALGPICIQTMFRDDVAVVTEINARFGGGFPLSVAAGINSVELFVARAIGRDVEVPPLDSYQCGLYMTRFDESFFLSEAELGQSAVVGADAGIARDATARMAASGAPDGLSRQVQRISAEHSAPVAVASAVRAAEDESQDIPGAVTEVINGILSDTGRNTRQFNDADVLMSTIGLDSLDLAVMTISLERNLGVDPFRDGRRAVRTFGELVAVYEDALEKQP